MLKPASLKSALSYPVTVSVTVAAIIVTLQWWSGESIDMLVMDGRVWQKWELWRALTSTLPHVNFMHLAFNLYWFWTFGTLLERVYGHVRFAGIILLLAFGSMLAEFTFLHGGVGLSGVGYGLWGLLWVLEQRDPRFAEAVDPQTSLTFVVWFFICIATTITGIMPVANIAHGMGACLGALLGLSVAGRGNSRSLGMAGAALMIAMVIAGSTMLWPRVNLTEEAEAYVENLGITRMQHDDPKGALPYLETSVKMHHTRAGAWYNLGLVYQELGRNKEALAAFDRALAMPDADENIRKVIPELKHELLLENH